MPFAVVRGEPITELPKDLYIPPQALEVFLEAFEGPLDLLLYLIRRQNLDILDIPLAEITRQYMQYIELMQELQLELAGEYMVMAATLAEIKSRMLLPRPKVEGDGAEEDPRAELVRRLQEYERFKRAAEDLDRLPRLERDTWCAGAELKDRKVVRLLPQVTLQEMLIAFKEVVVRAEMFSHHHISRERLSVRQRMTDILATLERASFVEFVRLFRPEEGRMGVTVTFIAILELMREGLLDIVQAEPFAPIHVRLASENRMLRLVANNEPRDAPPGAAGELAAESVYEEAATEENAANPSAATDVDAAERDAARTDDGEIDDAERDFAESADAAASMAAFDAAGIESAEAERESVETEAVGGDSAESGVEETSPHEAASTDSESAAHSAAVVTPDADAFAESQAPHAAESSTLEMASQENREAPPSAATNSITAGNDPAPHMEPGKSPASGMEAGPTPAHNDSESQGGESPPPDEGRS
ncbi:MAG: segregation/condensation protein A [Steroidobacteraceae bacterium]|nr:segregation/condensation protein A [Steroidobacteraceae bacterium]